VPRVAGGARPSDRGAGLYADEESHAGYLDGDGLQLPRRAGEVRPGEAGESGPRRQAVLPEYARALPLLLRKLRRRLRHRPDAPAAAGADAARFQGDAVGTFHTRTLPGVRREEIIDPARAGPTAEPVQLFNETNMSTATET